jgi:hypothetical protein
MHRILTLALLGAAPALACSLPTEPIQVEFSVEQQGTFAAMAPVVAVEAPGRIETSGSLRTPCLPYDATGSLSQESRTITLTVIGRASGACANRAEGTLIYRAAITRLPPGRYDLRVVHTYRDAQWPTRVVLQERLRVE